jgi:hypothetical protein
MQTTLNQPNHLYTTSLLGRWFFVASYKTERFMYSQAMGRHL